MTPLDVIEEKIVYLHDAVAKIIGGSIPGTLHLVLEMEAKTQEAKLKRVAAALSILCDIFPEIVTEKEISESLSTGLSMDAIAAEVVQ